MAGTLPPLEAPAIITGRRSPNDTIAIPGRQEPKGGVLTGAIRYQTQRYGREEEEVPFAQQRDMYREDRGAPLRQFDGSRDASEPSAQDHDAGRQRRGAPGEDLTGRHRVLHHAHLDIDARGSDSSWGRRAGIIKR